MLIELCIRNLALIDEARVQFGEGLNILTGETGAGKTVVVEAVNLLLGGRADASLVRRGSAKAEIQGVFLIPPPLRNCSELLEDIIDSEDQLIVRRIISSDGKSRGYINDRMVTAGTLSEIGKHLVDLHGQHEHQSLFKVALHVDYLDKYGGEELLSLREEFMEKSRVLRRLRDELTKLKGAERELLARKDLLSFQINELDKAALVTGEDIELMRERDILKNAEKLYLSSGKVNNALTGADDGVSATGLLAQAIHELRLVSDIDPDLDELAERLNGLLIEIEDCATNLRGYGEKLDFPPGRLQEIEDRLAIISLLKKKYGSTIEQIIAYRNKAIEELQTCDTAGERMENLEHDISQVEKDLASVALNQSMRRRETASRFSSAVKEQLADLSMPDARFEVLFSRESDEDGLTVDGERVNIYPSGIDRIEFMISANKGEKVMPLARVASGGEISRVMLALKIVLTGADEVPTLVFDEIDVGIGGKTAISIGQKMSVLGKKRQVFSVTHLSQIASYADRHFSVCKREAENRTVTEIEELAEGSRIKEIARLLSGDMRSEVSLKHAEELIIEAQKSKTKHVTRIL